MKKKGMRLGILCILVCLCAVPVWVRAGGGGSSGGGGGSAGGSSYHSGRSSGGGTSDIVSAAQFGLGVFVASGGAGAAVLLLKARRARRRTHRAMAVFSESGRNWDYREVQKQVEESYFQIQECWRRMDVTYGVPYMSERLQKDFNVKLQWMHMRGEEVVQKKVKLLSAIPVGVQDEEGEDQDVIWYLIHGKMTGFYINKNTREIIRGKNRLEAFFEYWKFVYRNERWVLDEIKQKEEIDIDAFHV